MTLLSGRDIRTVSREELELEAKRLEKQIIQIRREIGMRTKNDDWVWGFRDGTNYYDFGKDFSYAANYVEEKYGSGSSHRLQKIYI